MTAPLARAPIPVVNGLAEARAQARELIFEQAGWLQIECDLLRDAAQLADDSVLHHAVHRILARIGVVASTAASLRNEA